jgi:hypothetical protein
VDSPQFVSELGIKLKIKAVNYQQYYHRWNWIARINEFMYLLDRASVRNQPNIEIFG